MKDITYAAPKNRRRRPPAVLNGQGRPALASSPAAPTSSCKCARGRARHRCARRLSSTFPDVNELSYDPAKGLVIGAPRWPCCQIYENATIAKAYPGLMDAVSLIGGIQIQKPRQSRRQSVQTRLPRRTAFRYMIAPRRRVRHRRAEGDSQRPGRENSAPRPARPSWRRGEFLMRFRFPPPKRKQSGAAYLRFIPAQRDGHRRPSASACRCNSMRRKSKCTAARVRASPAVAPTTASGSGCGRSARSARIWMKAAHRQGRVDCAGPPRSRISEHARRRRLSPPTSSASSSSATLAHRHGTRKNHDSRLVVGSLPRSRFRSRSERSTIVPERTSSCSANPSAIAAVAIILIPTAFAQRYLSGIVWPEPPIITPGAKQQRPVRRDRALRRQEL